MNYIQNGLDQVKHIQLQIAIQLLQVVITIVITKNVIMHLLVDRMDYY